ncbi:MAG: PilZ domain-containing protein [Acidobacteriota bacterium]|nr:PilZ domain-containing protein [Acidobacteriota bacterium]
MLNTEVVVHLHEDDLELYLRGQLESRLLWSTEEHLIQCEICRMQLSNCLGQRLALQIVRRISGDTNQKRSEPRFETKGEGSLQEFHPLSLERYTVQIVNVSKNGLGLVIRKAILPGTIVQLRIKDIVELGNVRYCSASTEGFRIGLRLHGEG